MINRGQNYIADVNDEELKAMVDNGYLNAVSDERIPEMDGLYRRQEFLQE